MGEFLEKHQRALLSGCSEVSLEEFLEISLEKFLKENEKNVYGNFWSKLKLF